MNPDLDLRYDLARRISSQASKLALSYFQSDILVEQKSDASPVTVADREAERLLRTLIEAQFPDDGIIGEEWGVKEGSSEFRWILDPIDGTKSFIHGVPLFGTMVAVESSGKGLIGVVEIPALNVCVDAMTGGGCWETRPDGSRVPARVDDQTALADGLLLTTDWQGFVKRNATDLLLQLGEQCRILRTWGDCYGYYLVATGRAVGMIDPRLNIWDAAALQPIVEEAGGTFSDWQGNPRIDSGDGFATGGPAFEPICQILRSAKPLEGI